MPNFSIRSTSSPIWSCWWLLCWLNRASRTHIKPTNYSHDGLRATMDDEIKSIHKNDAWQLTNLPPNQRVITTKWIYYTQTKTHAKTKIIIHRPIVKPKNVLKYLLANSIYYTYFEILKMRYLKICNSMKRSCHYCGAII